METQIRSLRVPGTMGRRGYHAEFDGIMYELSQNEMEANLIMVISAHRRTDRFADAARFRVVVESDLALKKLMSRFRMKIGDIFQRTIETGVKAYRLGYKKSQIMIDPTVINPGLPYINPSILAELAAVLRESAAERQLA